MLENLVAIQCMKYTEWKDGKLIEVVISSMNGVSHKVGQALGAMLVGFLLSASGYNGALEVQDWPSRNSDADQHALHERLPSGGQAGNHRSRSRGQKEYTVNLKRKEPTSP